MDRKSKARAYLETCPPAISGQGGHNQTFKVACKLVWDFALSYEEKLELLRQYSDRCSPPWTDKELIHKLDDALKASRQQRAVDKRQPPSISNLGIQPCVYPPAQTIHVINIQEMING